MGLIKLTIDNKCISVPVGTTVLKAARLVDVYIPTLCSHPDLTPTALEKPTTKIFQGRKKIKNTQLNKKAVKCGMCVVEIEGENGFFNSCITLAKEGMIVFTNREKTMKERRKNLVPILSRHRHACLTCAQQEGCSQTQCSSNVPENERCCSQFGNCELIKVVNFVGISENTPKWNPSSIPIIENEPLFIVDYNLCIGCIRCVRACNNLRGVGAIGFVWDANGTLQVGSISQTLAESECKFCTACVEVCPTGALRDKSVSSNKKEQNLVPCRAACPANVDVPWFLRMISQNNHEAAYSIIREKVPFPAVLGRICMHPCESECRRNKINNAISICTLKRFCSDEAQYQHNNVYKKRLPKINETGKKIAIIGAGPTGLTAAFYLKKKGHQVTLYEEKNKAGGMLRYGIPNYRLPPDVLDQEIENILSTGIELKTNSKLGTNFNLTSLQNNKTDAILLAVGAQNDRQLPIKGSNLRGVIGAINFLFNVTENKDIKLGKNVLIIGGGNIAVDVGMTAVRLGAEQVSMLCLESEKDMPASAWELSAAKAEGIKILPSLVPQKIIGKNGHVVGINAAKCTSIFDSNGVFNPQCDNKTIKKISTDQIIVAIGQKTDFTYLGTTDISIIDNLITVNDKTLETTIPGIYAAGDAISLPGSVIMSIASGRKAAKAIDSSLGGTGIISEVLFHKSIPNGYLGKNKGFSKWVRKNGTELDTKERCNNFDEIKLGLEKNLAIQEAKRCLQCDLRLNLDCNPTPPKRLLPLTTENLETLIPDEVEGVYKLFNENYVTTAIVGTNTLRKNLMAVIKDNTAVYFEFEKNKMYSKRESELIQKHLQEYGSMPGGNGENDLDDLF